MCNVIIFTYYMNVLAVQECWTCTNIFMCLKVYVWMNKLCMVYDIRYRRFPESRPPKSCCCKLSYCNLGFGIISLRVTAMNGRPSGVFEPKWHLWIKVNKIRDKRLDRHLFTTRGGNIILVKQLCAIEVLSHLPLGERYKIQF